MFDPPMTHKQGVALSKYLHELRPDWDTPGIEAALGHARGRAGGCDLAVAAIRAAQSAHNRTPAVIGMDGDHWRTHAVTRATTKPLEPHERCSICSKAKDRCVNGPRHGDDDHIFQPDVPGADLPAWLDPTTGELLDGTAILASLRAELHARGHELPAADPSPDTTTKEYADADHWPRHRDR